MYVKLGSPLPVCIMHTEIEYLHSFIFIRISPAMKKPVELNFF